MKWESHESCFTAKEDDWELRVKPMMGGDWAFYVYGPEKSFNSAEWGYTTSDYAAKKYAEIIYYALKCGYDMEQV